MTLSGPLSNWWGMTFWKCCKGEKIKKIKKGFIISCATESQVYIYNDNAGISTFLLRSVGGCHYSDGIPVTFPPCQAGWVQSDSSEGLPVLHGKLSPGPAGRSQDRSAGKCDLLWVYLQVKKHQNITCQRRAQYLLSQGGAKEYVTAFKLLPNNPSSDRQINVCCTLSTSTLQMLWHFLMRTLNLVMICKEYCFTKIKW